MIFEQIIKHGFSVRKVEEIVRDYSNQKDDDSTAEKKPKFPKEYQSVKKQLDKIFKSSIDFSMNEKGKGKITIPFHSEEDFNRIKKLVQGAK